MTSRVPSGWREVFAGPCLEADLVVAVLEAHGLNPVAERLNAGGLWPTAALDDCRLYVPTDQEDKARELLAEGPAET